MPVTLRRRLQCHYCGGRLNTTSRAGNKIRCTQCLADNYFDVHGNLVDVPIEDVRTNSKADAVDFEVASESSIFCSTCLKNQHLYVTALSEYLPDTDDPRYDEIEAALPAFKEQLELRYPQCCANCEPKVQQQLREANYAAKSDHLRRTLEKRRRVGAATRLNWKSIFVFLTGMGYLSSVLVQIVWHVLASQSNTNSIALGTTALQCLTTFPIPSQCTKLAAHHVPFALFLGFVSIWWNPHWQHRLMQREGRLVGLRRYYQAQVYLMAFRFLAWVLLTDVPGIEKYEPPLHGISAILIAGISLWSVTAMVKVDTTPLVDWSQAQQPLLRAGQFSAPTAPTRPEQPAQVSNHFPMQDLAGPPRTSAYEPWRPPTPPSTQEDDMDWTPSQSAFNPQTKMHIPRREDPSPFFGTLPAAPARGSLNARHVTAEKPPAALGIPPGFFGLSKSAQEVEPPASAADADPRSAFAPPKLFISNQDQDTGLEGIFDKIFSVRDDAAQKQAQDMTHGRHGRIPVNGAVNSTQFDGTTDGRPPNAIAVRKIVSCVIIVVLSISAVTLCANEYLFAGEGAVPAGILPSLACIPLYHISDELVYSPYAALAGLVLLLAEATVLPSAYFILSQYSPDFVPLWNKLMLGAVCLLLVQEVYYFARLQTPKTRRATARPVRPQQRANSNHIFEATTTAQSHPSPTFPPHHQRHHPPSHHQSPWDTLPPSPLKNRDSNESIGTTTSVNTTSTASGWKTPRAENRSFDFGNEPRRSARSTSKETEPRGLTNSFGGLGLGSGTSVAGPRSSNRNSTFGRY